MSSSFNNLIGGNWTLYGNYVLVAVVGCGLILIPNFVYSETISDSLTPSMCSLPINAHSLQRHWSTLW